MKIEKETYWKAVWAGPYQGCKWIGHCCKWTAQIACDGQRELRYLR